MVRAVTRVMYRVEKFVETVKEDADELISSTVAHVLGLLESLPGATACREGAFEGGLLRWAHVPDCAQAREQAAEASEVRRERRVWRCAPGSPWILSRRLAGRRACAWSPTIACDSSSMSCWYHGRGVVFLASAFSTAIRTRVFGGDARPPKPCLLRLQYRWPDEPFGSPS